MVTIIDLTVIDPSPGKKPAHSPSLSPRMIMNDVMTSGGIMEFVWYLREWNEYFV